MRTCWDWCTQNHEHIRTPDRAAQTSANYRLTPEEKKRLFVQTGQNFDDHAQYKTWCRANGRRDLEPGEPQDVTRRDMEQWYRDTGGQGEPPHDWRTAKGGRSPIPRPWHDEA